VPLIAEYDAAHVAARPVGAAALLGPVKPVSIRERRRPHWGVVLGLVLVLVAGLVAYRAIAASRHAPRVPAPAGAGRHRPSHPAPSTAPASHPAPSTPAPVPYAHTVAIRVMAIEDCWVEFTTPAGRFLFQLIVAGGTSRRWVFQHAVNVRLGNPGGIRLTVDGKNPLPPGTARPTTIRLRPGGKISIQRAGG
jgi:hypothetical protein